MFENLIAQEGVRAGLTEAARDGTVPPALLFSGPPASGKLTAALELARVLSCTGSKAWNCPCPHCAQHRLLSHGDLLLFGKRSLPEEIGVARDFLGRSPGQTSAYFFARAARKLLARFNPVLWAGEEAKLGKALPLVQSAGEGLDLLRLEMMGASLSGPEAKAADAVLADCRALEAFCPEQPGVFMIRNMEVWAQLAPTSARKTIVIENADRMQDSSRNAMLKILEEPPETVRFVLLTARRASMMATILSRSRIFNFVPRDEEASRLVASRVFKSQEPLPSLQAFFESKTPFPPAQAIAAARRFIGCLLVPKIAGGASLGPLASNLAQEAAASGATRRAVLDEIVGATGNFGSKDKAMAGSFLRFVKALLSLFTELLAESSGYPETLALIGEWSRQAREAALQYSSLNRNPELLVEVLADSFGDEP
jgi:DNA polymerase III subunit gamma/tau